MSADLSAYIHFDGKTREALLFYHSVFGGDLTLERYGDYGISDDPADAERILYGVLHSPDGFVLRGTDRSRTPHPPELGNRWALCLNGSDRALLSRCWQALSEGATIAEPMTTAAWGDSNGVLEDRFGITWVVNIGASKQRARRSAWPPHGHAEPEPAARAGAGSGKPTLARGLERRLFAQGRACAVLDGDEVRAGLTRGLGFSGEVRRENVRRCAEVARLKRHAGLIAIVARSSRRSGPTG